MINEKQKQLLVDTLTTAVECSSIHYWCAAQKIEYGKDGVTKVIGPFDVEDESNKWSDITLETVQLGFERIMNGSVSVNKNIRDDVTSDWNDPENSCRMDSESADCVVQAGLFNEIIYG